MIILWIYCFDEDYCIQTVPQFKEVNGAVIEGLGEMLMKIGMRHLTELVLLKKSNNLLLIIKILVKRDITFYLKYSTMDFSELNEKCLCSNISVSFVVLGFNSSLRYITFLSLVWNFLSETCNTHSDKLYYFVF